MRAGLFALLILAGTAARAETVTVMVFDASGSMWNRLEGDRSRIEVARDVMGEYFATRDTGTPISVLAYGHRRRGDCGDIQVIAPMQRHDGSDLTQRLRALNPQGMTPLTYALEQARAQIPPQAESADIVLITDGLENCGGDPCALAAHFASEGIALRAHVVGFGMTTGEVGALSCLPDQTGGLLLEAATGAELAAALAQVTEAPATPALLELSLIAVDAATGAPLGPADWTILDSTGEVIATGEQRDPFHVDLGPADYIVTATTPGFAGRTTLSVTGDLISPVEVALTEDRPAATLDAPSEAPAGTALSVGWTGPDADGDRIAIAEVGAAVGDTLAVTLTRFGAPATLRLPDETGQFELRYEQANPQRVLATRPVTLITSAATIAPPGQITPGERFEVQWTGPSGPKDEIVLAAPNTSDDERITATQTRWGSPARLKAPDSQGPYELRYRVGASGRIIARIPIMIGGSE
ncbi:MAG: VWA domain-containing protein [Paracoccaceae bacterium]